MRTLTPQECSAEFNRLADSFDDDWTDALNEMKPIALENIQSNFDMEQAASGEPWQKLSPYTIQLYGPHDILHLTGALEAAATGQGQGKVDRVVDGNELQLGVDTGVFLGGIPYAGTHQYGGTGGEGNEIPARPFMNLSDETAARCEEIAAKHAYAKLS